MQFSILNLFCSAIGRGLLLGGSFYWIGLSDIESERNYVWVNGDQASSTDETLWRTGQLHELDEFDNVDCCFSSFHIAQPDVIVGFCSFLFHGICEKPI